jgi:hypothetical protein
MMIFGPILATVLATLWFANGAHAQQSPTGLSYTDTAVALSTASSCPTAAARAPYAKAMELDNTTGAIDVYYCLIQPGQTTCTASAAPPSSKVAAGSNQWFQAGSAPQNGMCLVAASGTPSITIRVGQ